MFGFRDEEWGVPDGDIRQFLNTKYYMQNCRFRDEQKLETES